MNQVMILLTVCIIALAMFAIFYSLWDVLMGRWSEKKRIQSQIEDQNDFDNS
ncbi:unnamed protein product [Commensalibacter communis]|uniref:Uncharacterized protein n=1 Tax=Commensalibacter communis TaxID=2972786 RepID=A0A9W4TLQ4_9PROT|nr:hypothetical protein [Commensalibacter communis]CAI3922161.1 unnamed protein product [Commensalibacter communis]CAI3922711.1 unnamed protein product [Commensalibacter communis]CAI3922818.1 unnamed protein product [Commensalibacter communis]CAI3922959.1 unnamed protein product [Commensalibacter communis]CAI3923657.1 unnamed protein product [Commensalibacter communis]